MAQTNPGDETVVADIDEDLGMLDLSGDEVPDDQEEGDLDELLEDIAEDDDEPILSDDHDAE